MQISRVKFIVYANLLYKYSAGALNRLSGSECSEHWSSRQLSEVFSPPK